MRVTDPTFCTPPPIDYTPFRGANDPRLKQLIRDEAEEIRDPVQILYRKCLLWPGENFTDPALRMPTPLREILPGVAACSQEAVDVFFDEQVGSHGLVKCYHV